MSPLRKASTVAERKVPKNARKQPVIITITGCFLAGALGLEPRAYGFGDEADKSASGGTSFEVNISTFQKQIAAAFTKTD